MISTRGVARLAFRGVPEKARYRKASKLVNGSNSQSATQPLLPRAWEMLIDQVINATTFTTGIRNAKNQPAGILAALSSGNIWKMGSHTANPGSLSVFRQMSWAQ